MANAKRSPDAQSTSGGTTGGAKPAPPKPGRRPATTGKAAGSGAGLQKDLRQFVEAHPGGWGHNEWIGLVNHLRDRGHDTSDTDAVGMALERERLTLVLERVPGLGPQRVKAIADNYPRLWNVMQAGAEEIATVANVPRAVAEKVKKAIG